MADFNSFLSTLHFIRILIFFLVFFGESTTVYVYQLELNKLLLLLLLLLLFHLLNGNVLICLVNLLTIVPLFSWQHQCSVPKPYSPMLTVHHQHEPFVDGTPST